ncbi:MAG: ATP-dependent RNA helicase [Prochlorococcus sp. SP3034]|nr:ATP-dependent RNA helicase [Prochlorococcus sp. SP3034]|tara:strand:- start:21403 stop:23178 length:1776 start_codon:yes stop_codon:yes gene_type:complete
MTPKRKPLPSLLEEENRTRLEQEKIQLNNENYNNDKNDQKIRSINIEGFNDFGFNQSILNSLDKKGYKNPTPIQKESIPELMLGRDLLGQAQTGTGKTAAFALPLIHKLNKNKEINAKVLVMTPTRELATQVAESFKSYSSESHDIKTIAIYGGTDFRNQIIALKKKIDIVVGTPGRIMDHIRQGTLKIDKINCLVLDEADEMLKMGFLEDIEWIIDKLPQDKQMVLFSATMPNEIKIIAKKYLKDPAEIKIKSIKKESQLISQKYINIQRHYKLEALRRILEINNEGVIIFVRTKSLTTSIAEELEFSGHSVAVLNGDIPQNQREATVDRLRKGFINILVATDVAARGLDVDRIKLVINYDFPFDKETYTHRIGRTGRAGRSGEAILFVNRREKHFLKNLQNSTKNKIEEFEIPNNKLINEKRMNKLTSDINNCFKLKESDNNNKALMIDIFDTLKVKYSLNEEEIAMAAINLAIGKKPFFMNEDETWIYKQNNNERERSNRNANTNNRIRSSNRRSNYQNNGFETFKFNVGKSNRIRVANIISSICNATNINGRTIGKIQIFSDYSLVDLPKNLHKDTKQKLKDLKIRN